MSWGSELAKLRRELIARMDMVSTGLFGWTLTSGSSSMGDKDSVQTGDEPDENGQQGQRPVRRIEPWGLRSRPPAKVRSLWIRLGSSNVLYLGIAPTKAYGPDSLEEGESQLYCSAGGTRVWLDKDGNVKIDAANGKDVIVNGGSKKVARVDDTAKAGSLMGTWMGQVEGFINGLAAGTVAPLSGTFATTPGIAVINSGADRFKG